MTSMRSTAEAGPGIPSRSTTPHRPAVPRSRWRRLARVAGTVIGLGLVGYIGVWVWLGMEAQRRLAQPLPAPIDAADGSSIALVLGNRAWIDGKPNPCLTGRVDTALALAASGAVHALLLSGGRDVEDGRIESVVMERHVIEQGFTGELILERRSSSTLENIAMSARLLDELRPQRVVVVTEPFHLWRAERLVHANGLDRRTEVQYVAAPTACWRESGMWFRGAMREPLAIVHNFLHGYFRWR